MPPVRNDQIVNYNIRPAKNVERKIISEILSSFNHYITIADYCYIGFGSSYFTDFILFHKLLGINDLISIESDQLIYQRANFNKPYGCINIYNGTSNDVLLDIDISSKKTILWLDYTKPFNKELVDDLNYFVNNCNENCINFYITTFNIDIKKEADDDANIKTRIDRYFQKNAECKKYLPQNIIDEIKNKEDFIKSFQPIVTSIINQTLMTRNSYPGNKKLLYRQLFNYVYADGVLMLTLGGVIFNEEESQVIDTVCDKKSDIVKQSDSYFEIKVPNLTIKEINEINSHMPEDLLSVEFLPNLSKEFHNFITEESLRNYAKIYRYFPNFTEANL